MIKEINIPSLLNPQSISDLTKQLSEAENDGTRFVILKGSETIFCNGLDLKWVAQNAGGNYMKEMQEYGAFLKKLQTGSFISIAVVTGAASGGGMGIVCACDHVIADEASTFALPEGLLGLIPGMIMPALLNRLSPQRIKKMVLTGANYPSKTAADWGIVDDVVTKTTLQDALTKAISSMKNCKKDPVGDVKQLLYTANINKDELAQLGMNILAAKLNEAEISERLINLAEFME
ncbi:MAG TPA: enoyl-CoA hydratase/isomerase family protein [Bacteroidia bacterium]|jgi:methylglutaconyl-CoA hydratase|nr:enoyl-CoA hydratase/isomerase family protein [Bacteroidia bacterium]